MNAARALGNLGDRANIPLLIEALDRSPYEEVRAMSAWALGRLGGEQARNALEARRNREQGMVKEEIESSLFGRQ